MARLLSLLMMLALVLANGTAIASATCHHADFQAHVSARQSSDSNVSEAAFLEDGAAVAASKRGVLADGAAVQLAGFLVPAGPSLAAPGSDVGASERPNAAPKLAGRNLSPLLEPPLV